jgi:hypothetical protein
LSSLLIELKDFTDMNLSCRQACRMPFECKPHLQLGA